MTKLKYLIVLFLLSIILFLIPTIVNADDTFTTTDGIVVKQMKDL